MIIIFFDRLEAVVIIECWRFALSCVPSLRCFSSFSARVPAVFHVLKPVGQAPYPRHSDSSQASIVQESPPPSPARSVAETRRPYHTPSQPASAEAGCAQVGLNLEAEKKRAFTLAL